MRRAVTDPDSYIAATQLGITMASLGLGWIGEPALASMIEPAFRFLPTPIAATTAHSIAVAIAFAIVTALHIVFGELAPKTIALERAEATALLVVKPTEIFMKVFWPFIRVLNGAGQAVVRMLGLRSKGGHAMVHSEEELKMLVTASQEAGVLEENEEQMLHRVFGFADLTAGQIMTPRTEIVAVAADTPREVIIEHMVARPPHAAAGLPHESRRCDRVSVRDGPGGRARLAGRGRRRRRPRPRGADRSRNARRGRSARAKCAAGACARRSSSTSTAEPPGS